MKLNFQPYYKDGRPIERDEMPSPILAEINIEHNTYPQKAQAYIEGPPHDYLEIHTVHRIWMSANGIYVIGLAHELCSDGEWRHVRQEWWLTPPIA